MNFSGVSMPADVLIIFGSSRSDGNTRKALDMIFQDREHDLVDLREKDINYYDYQTKHDDDFLPIAKRMGSARVLVFSTPVYWYSMSGILKTFFDRFTDLITDHKPVGKQLVGKRCFVVSSGAGNECPPSFVEPFRNTCDFLGMDFRDLFYYYPDMPHKQAKQAALDFAKQIYAKK